jgi:hypothetical protein
VALPLRGKKLGKSAEGKAGGGEGDMTGTGAKGGVSKVLKPGNVVRRV